MILWATIACAAVGFVLGIYCRVAPLVAASVLVAVCWWLLSPADEPALVTSVTIVVLLFFLQAFFMAGAIVGPRGHGDHSHQDENDPPRDDRPPS